MVNLIIPLIYSEAIFVHNHPLQLSLAASFSSNAYLVYYYRRWLAGSHSIKCSVYAWLLCPRVMFKRVWVKFKFCSRHGYSRRSLGLCNAIEAHGQRQSITWSHLSQRDNTIVLRRCFLWVANVWVKLPRLPICAVFIVEPCCRHIACLEQKNKLTEAWNIQSVDSSGVHSSCRT